MPPEGSSEITTSIGGRCKAREDFSRPVLISREAWPVFLRCFSCAARVSYRLSSVIGVAMAEGLHLFPFRTEKLSPPAPMVLPGRPGGRVGRRPLNHAKSPGPEGAGALSVFAPADSGVLPRPVPLRPSVPGGPHGVSRAL